ncbi:MAG TPA: hypothetical protein ENK06_13930, partial [Gammaproteobacteria bacterium]|nr:hypothetical protein [Gammaproteobacteria bacterium]
MLRSIERAKLLDNGQLGAWETSRSRLNIPRRCAKTSVIGNRLYAFGGFGGALLDTIESAAIKVDGSLGAWRVEGQRFRIPRYVHSLKKASEAVYAFGGHNEKQGTGLREVEWSPIQAGIVTGWKPALSMRIGRYAHNAIGFKGWLYVLGGLDGINFLSSIERAVLSPKNHEIIAWQAGGLLSSPRANFAVVQYQNFVYLVGGTNTLGYYDSVEFAQINEHGDIGFWGSEQEAYDYQNNRVAARVGQPVDLPHKGKIAEAITSGSYTYIRVISPSGEEWLAAGRADYRIG